jgi:tagaturonate reductase
MKNGWVNLSVTFATTMPRHISIFNQTMKKLNRATAALPQHRSVKVLQFGEGNFLRAFVDWVVDVMNEKTDFNGAVRIIQPIRQGMGAMVNNQDGLYHVVLNGMKQGSPSQETRLITCVAGVINPFEDYSGYLREAENAELKFIVSNTTESGITFSAADTDSAVLAETFPGKLTALLYHRFTFFKGASEKGLIIMPCELIDKNGVALKSAILQYIAHWNLPEAFRQWITTSNTFCNTLVDRIVPGFPKDTIKEIQQATGYEDNLVVMAEPFHLWVIEADDRVRMAFPADQAGLQVKFVKDMAPYRTRKVRILNGAHTALVPVAYLHGLRTVKESVEDQATGEFIRNVIFNEIIPTLDLSKDELQQFADDVIERFKNPFIRHELSSIALNSISKYQVRVLPSVLQYIKIKKQLPKGLLFSLAALIRFYKGEWRGEPLPLNDSADITAFFNSAWKSDDLKQVTAITLSNTDFWGTDLTQLSGVSEVIEQGLQQLELLEQGIKSNTVLDFLQK